MYENSDTACPDIEETKTVVVFAVTVSLIQCCLAHIVTVINALHNGMNLISVGAPCLT